MAASFAAVLLLTACGETSPYTCPPLAEGVESVANEGPGRWAQDGLSPWIDEELWRRGGTREGEELSLPTFSAVSPGGRLALPDFRLAEATVIEPDGTWAGPWTRSGEGPEEIRAAVAAQWTPDGHLLVFDVAGAKIVRLADEARAAEVIALVRSFTAPVGSGGELLRAGLLADGSAN